jgi:hypothetical protein
MAKAARAIDEPFRHRRLVPAPDAASAAYCPTVDESIRATIPGLHYAGKWKRPHYGLPELGRIIELAAYDVSVNVVFLGGADFDPPLALGSTDRARYVKVTTLEEAQQPELRASLEQASRTPGWK